MITITNSKHPNRVEIMPFVNLLMRYDKTELRLRAHSLGIKRCGSKTIKRHICYAIVLEELRTLSDTELQQLIAEREEHKALTWKSLY